MQGRLARRPFPLGIGVARATVQHDQLLRVRCGSRGAGIPPWPRRTRRSSIRRPRELIARVTIVLSTVSRSSVELTARLTSPSAVSCSTDRVSSAVRARSSVNSRTFSIGDDRLVGERLEERDLLGGERPPLPPADRDGADRDPSRSIGTPRTVPPERRRSRDARVLRIRSDVSLLDDSRVENGPAGERASAGRPREEPLRRVSRSRGPPPLWPPCESGARRTGRRYRCSASHSRVALAAIASNTGWTSVGELEITCRISAVAVCCSRASVTCACASSAHRSSAAAR